MENLKRTGSYKNNQMDILEPKNTITDIEISVDRFYSRSDNNKGCISGHASRESSEIEVSEILSYS